MSLADRKKCQELVVEATSSGAKQKESCEILEISERTLQRWKLNPEREDQRRGPKMSLQKSITVEEKVEMIKVANSEAYRDLNPHQMVARMADEGM